MKNWFKKVLTPKNIIIAICVPSVIAVAYFGYVSLDRRAKQKKLMDVITKSFDVIPSEHKINQPDGLSDVIIDEWNIELKKLSDKAFTAFYNYAMVTLPNGKNKEDGVWVYEKKNTLDYNTKKDLLATYKDELNKNTKVMDYFNQIAEKIK